MRMITYLIVDDTDGSVVAEAEHVEDLARIFTTMRSPARRLRIVVFNDSGGALARTESWVTIRTP
jgi:hypothetical protein